MAAPAVNPNNPLANPNIPLSGNALIQAAQALANAQTAGPLSELQQAIARNNSQGNAVLGRLNQYFQGLGQFGQQGVTDEQNIANGLNSQLSGIANDTQGQLRGIGQNATDSLLKYAPQSDSSHSLANPALQSLQTEIARQQGLAAQNEGAQRAFGATQGANYGSLAASNLQSFGLRGQEDLAAEARNTNLQNVPLQSKVAALKAQEGALFATDLGKLRQQEITNQFTGQGLGIRQATLNQTIANDQAKNALTLRGQNITISRNQQLAMQSDRTYQLDAKKFGAAQAKDAYLRSHGLGPYKPSSASLPKFTPTGTPTLSPVEQQQRFAQIDALRQLIRDGQQHGQNEQQIRGFLADGQNPAKVRYDPALIDAAYALDGWGFLTPFQVTNLNKLGLIVGNRYRRGNAPNSGAGFTQYMQNVGNTVGTAVGNAVGP